MRRRVFVFVVPRGVRGTIPGIRSGVDLLGDGAITHLICRAAIVISAGVSGMNSLPMFARDPSIGHSRLLQTPDNPQP